MANMYFFLIFLLIEALAIPSLAQCDPHENCPTPDTSDLTYFCQESQYYINCLYKEVIYEESCSDELQARYRDTISSMQTKRAKHGCSAAVGLTSSLTLCVASLIYVIFSK